MSRKERMAAVDDAVGAIVADRTRRSPTTRSMIPIVSQVESVFQDSAQQLEELRRKGHVLHELEVKDLHSTKYRDRHDAAFIGESFEELVQDILKNGQLVPVLVRASSSGSGYELIAGHRRVEACRRLGRSVIARELVASDQQLVVAMVRENEARENISSFERATQLKALIETSLMTRQEINDMLGISKGHLSNLLKFAELPRRIIDFLGDPREMKIAEGAQLARLIENSEIAERVFKTIDALETSDLTAAERIRRIYHAALTTSNAAVRNGVEKGSRVIRSRTAQVLVRLTSHNGRPVLRFSSGLSEDSINDVFAGLPQLLRDCGLDVET